MVDIKSQIEAYLVSRIKGKSYAKPRKVLDAKIYDPTSDSFFIKGAKENYTVEPLVPLSEYEALQAKCEKLVEVLEAICLMQAHYYGDATQTHLDLPELAAKARSALTAYRKGTES